MGVVVISNLLFRIYFSIFLFICCFSKSFFLNHFFEIFNFPIFKIGKFSFLFSFLLLKMVQSKKTKRFFVEEIHKSDSSLSKTKLFKMKINELETMFNNVNLTPSTADNYSRATFDDISEDEKEEIPENIPEQEPISEPIPEPIPEPVKKEEIKKEKFYRKDIKTLFLNAFNKDVTDLIKDLDDDFINDELAINEFNMMYDETLTLIEEYTKNMDLSERDIEYIDKYFLLQEKRLLRVINI